MFTRVNGMMAETVLCISLRNAFPINVNILCLVIIFKNSNILFLIHCMFLFIAMITQMRRNLTLRTLWSIDIKIIFFLRLIMLPIKGI